jgi:hypothetical protein
MSLYHFENLISLIYYNVERESTDSVTATHADKKHNYKAKWGKSNSNNIK